MIFSLVLTCVYSGFVVKTVNSGEIQWRGRNFARWADLEPQEGRICNSVTGIVGGEVAVCVVKRSIGSTVFEVFHVLWMLCMC